MLTVILEALYFFLPAYVANMAPVFAVKILPHWNTPMDCGVMWRGKPLLGTHKTWRGLFAGIVAAIGVVYAQQAALAVPVFAAMSIVPYHEVNVLALGALLGAGALLGDALKSMIKRRVGKQSGERWMPYDQLDFVIGGLLAVSVLYVPSWQHIIALLLVSPALHIAVNYLGYVMKLKQVPW